MDYCKEFPALVDHCYIYRHDGTDWLKTSDFGDLDKLNVLFSLYLQRSDEMVETVLKLYVRLAEHRRDAVFHLPELPKWDDGPSSANARSEEHTSELQSLMRISYAVFCLKKKTTTK